MAIIILSYELQKNKNTYQSKASTSVCISGINSVSSNVTTEILGQDQRFECRVEASSNSYPDIICGYFVGENNWPKNCPFSRWSGNTAIFLCDPNQPADDSIPLPQGGDRIAVGAMRGDALVGGNQCKNQWDISQNYVAGSSFYYIRQPVVSPSPSPTIPSSTTIPTATSTPTPTRTPVPTATPIVGYCGTAPIPTTSDTRFRWVPLCNGAVCRSNADCPLGVNNQPGWCYGFDNGFKCLQYQSSAISPSLTPTITLTLTPVPTATTTSTNTPTPTLTPTLTPTQSKSVILNIKLKFQGINRQPASLFNRMRVQVTLAGGSVDGSPVKPVTFVPNSDGTYSGKANFNARTGFEYKYYLLIKGPKHIQKKICESRPQEPQAGLYRCSNAAVVLNEGENNLDFSGVYQLTGDLPGEGGQDGIANSYDLSLVRNNLGKTEAAKLMIADLNLDDIINSQDYSLIITALSIKVDEL